MSGPDFTVEHSSHRVPVLVVDDDEVTLELVRRLLEKEGYSVHTASSGEDALEILRVQPFPIIVSDINMDGLDGLTLLGHIKALHARSVVILMTGYGSLETAMEAIRQGAFDYISKPLQPFEVRNLVRRAFRHWEVEHRGNDRPPDGAAKEAPRTLIGNSPRMVGVYRMIARASISSSNVLILGESGTGKELVARAIHDNSALKGRQFVTVNCGALAETLLESELFGHAKGAFTGALSNKRGLFEEADGGTIFLDEIGDITPGLQVKLLRVIQEGEFKPVGMNETRKVSVRVIAATHRNLEEFVRQGKFREDLYYRLKVILIQIPPLRERMEDVPALVNHFLAKHSARSGRQKLVISPEAMEALLKYPWPGNIRELEHAVERAIAMSSGAVLYPEDFPGAISDYQGKNLESAIAAAAPVALELVSEPMNLSLEAMEKAHIVKVLRDVSFNRSKAAQVLGIDRATLYRKAQRYGIELAEEKIARH